MALAGAKFVPQPFDGVAAQSQRLPRLRVGLQVLERAGQVADRVAHRVPVRQGRRMDRLHAEVVADADEDEPLPALRDAQPLRVEQLRPHSVPGSAERGKDVLEVALRGALDQARDVLGDERARLQVAQEPGELEEQVVHPLLGVAVGLDGVPPGLALARGGERGARRTAVEQVELSHLEADPDEDVLRGDLADVAGVEVGVRRGVGPVGLGGCGNELRRPKYAEAGRAVAERRTATAGEGADGVEAVPRHRPDLGHGRHSVRQLGQGCGLHLWP